MALMAVMMMLASALFSIISASTNHSVRWDLSSKSNISAWTSTTVFRVGDTLAFTYSPEHYVLEVNHVEYSTCFTEKAIDNFTGGNTLVHLTQPGHRFFIGRTRHCAMGLRVRVDVLPQNTSYYRNRRWIIRPQPYPARPQPTFPDLSEPLQIEGNPQTAVAAAPSGGIRKGIRKWFDHYLLWIALLIFTSIVSYFITMLLNRILGLFASTPNV